MMKKVTIILYVLLCSITTLNAQTTYIPDDNFEQALIDLGYDNILDDSVLTANINILTFLDVSGKNIADLTGIEDFSALTTLWCNSNQLASLDVSNNTALQILYCNSNLLTSIDLSQNTALQTLWCFSNELTNLDLTMNTMLTNLRCSSNQLTDIDISQNTNLTYLDCNNNEVSGIDVSQNTNLTYLDCSFNSLTTLDVSQNSALEELLCNFNQLSSLDISNNISLLELEISYNQFTSIDLSQNTALQSLNCIGNLFTGLDLTQNSSLTSLICSSNELTSLDLSQNLALQTLNCYYNQITSLDVSQNSDLISLNCSANQLTDLNVQNGNNINFTIFNATNNSSLTCIQVDDEAWSTANWTNIDPQTSFSEDCSNPGLTFVPDDNFENYLETHNADGNTVTIGDPTSMGNGIANDDYVTTANITVVTALNVSSQNISDLTGIEDFLALLTLFCQNNNISNLDVSQNTVLNYFNCSNNQLTNLDLTQNSLLTSFIGTGNQLTSLDLTQNTDLTYLHCDNNLLTNLDVSQNTALNYFNCSDNQLTNLDLTQNSLLISVICSGNQLTGLDIQNGNNTNISNTDFNATNNPDLTCIFVDDALWSTANWTNIDPSSTFVETQTQCDALSVEESYLYEFTVYPNPTKETLSIESNINTTINLYSITGKLLIEKTIKQGNNSIDLSALSSGVYFIKIKNKIKKIIIK